MICPKCGSECTSEEAPFSRYATVVTCPKQDFVGVQCVSCREGVMEWVSNLEATVSTRCNKCGYASTGIPLTWWKMSGKVDIDKRSELADHLCRTPGWSGGTSDFVGIGLENAFAASEAFETLTSDAENAATGFVVVRGALSIGSDCQPVVGIVCLNNDVKSHVPWLLDSVNTMEGTTGDNLLRWSDKSHFEFGLDSAPLAIYEFQCIGMSMEG